MEITSTDILKTIEKQVPKNWRNKSNIEIRFYGGELAKLIEILEANVMCEVMCN